MDGGGAGRGLGTIRLLFIANALKQHPVGLEEVADGIWSIHFCRVSVTGAEGCVKAPWTARLQLRERVLSFIGERGPAP